MFQAATVVTVAKNVARRGVLVIFVFGTWAMNGV